MTPEIIVTAARKWVGTRWKHQGRTAYGLDCVGLLIVVGRELGATIEDFTNYTHTPDPAVLRHNLLKHTTEIPVKDAAPGDILLMAVNGRRQHTGIRTDVGLIHAAAQYRKVVEHSIDDGWHAAIVQAFRWNGVTG